MTTLAKPKRLNQVESFRPGIVGSVGDANIFPQLAVSTPGLPIRWDNKFIDRLDNGSLVTGQPYVYDSSWNMGRSETTAYGLMQQDLRAPDKLHEPTLQGIPKLQWRNKIATVYEAKRTGDKFLPLPGPYQISQGEISRGGQILRVTDIQGLPGVVTASEASPSIGLARRNEAMFRRQFDANAWGVKAVKGE